MDPMALSKDWVPAQNLCFAIRHPFTNYRGHLKANPATTNSSAQVLCPSCRGPQTAERMLEVDRF